MSQLLHISYRLAISAVHYTTFVALFSLTHDFISRVLHMFVYCNRISMCIIFGLYSTLSPFRVFFLNFSDIWFIVIVDCLIRWTSDDTRQTDDRQTTHDDIREFTFAKNSVACTIHLQTKFIKIGQTAAELLRFNHLL